jgi:hypothetical protein
VVTAGRVVVVSVAVVAVRVVVVRVVVVRVVVVRVVVVRVVVDVGGRVEVVVVLVGLAVVLGRLVVDVAIDVLLLAVVDVDVVDGSDDEGGGIAPPAGISTSTVQSCPPRPPGPPIASAT